MNFLHCKSAKISHTWQIHDAVSPAHTHKPEAVRACRSWAFPIWTPSVPAEQCKAHLAESTQASVEWGISRPYLRSLPDRAAVSGRRLGSFAVLRSAKQQTGELAKALRFKQIGSISNSYPLWVEQIDLYSFRGRHPLSDYFTYSQRGISQFQLTVWFNYT